MTPAPLEKLTPVEIVRPNGPRGALFVTVAGFFLRAWVIMLAAAALAPHLHLSYWHSAVLVVLAGSLLQTDQYQLWSRARKRVRR